MLFSVMFQRKSTQALFTIEPMELMVGPGKTEEVKMTFISTREVKLVFCKDILIKRIEPKTGEVLVPPAWC